MDTILMVDDQEINLKVLEKFISLSEIKYEIFKASNGLEALNIIEKKCPDLILMDINMPIMDGIETTKHIRRKFNNLKLPIIMITGSDDKLLKLEALKAGIDEFLNKPLDKTEITTRIKILLDNKRLHQELEKSHEKLKKQMKLAKRVQETLQFQGCINHRGINIRGYYCPTYEIGGDIIDVKVIDDNRLMAFLGDVSGHGVSAAMVGTIVKTLLKYSPKEKGIRAIMDYVNTRMAEVLEDELDDMYVTGILFYIDFSSWKVQFINAGHHSPYFELDNIKTINMGQSGIPIGIKTGCEYSINEYDLSNLKRIVAFSDGLIETYGIKSFEKNYEIFSEDMIQKLVYSRKSERKENDDDLAILTFDFGKDG